MTEYALVGPGGEIKTYSRAVRPDVGTKPGWRWLPVERANVSCDPESETLTEEIVTIGNDSVTIARPARRKTTDELEQDRLAKFDESLPMGLARILTDLDNRVRALEHKAPRSVEDFRSAAVWATF